MTLIFEIFDSIGCPFYGLTSILCTNQCESPVWVCVDNPGDSDRFRTSHSSPGVMTMVFRPRGSSLIFKIKRFPSPGVSEIEQILTQKVQMRVKKIFKCQNPLVTPGFVLCFSRFSLQIILCITSLNETPVKARRHIIVLIQQSLIVVNKIYYRLYSILDSHTPCSYTLTGVLLSPSQASASMTFSSSDTWT